MQGLILPIITRLQLAGKVWEMRGLGDGRYKNGAVSDIKCGLRFANRLTLTHNLEQGRKEMRCSRPHQPLKNDRTAAHGNWETSHSQSMFFVVDRASTAIQCFEYLDRLDSQPRMEQL
jgi:hypothetical protein